MNASQSGCFALIVIVSAAAEGARAVWATADLIWTTLGDSAQDVNWYTKRATLVAVYGTTLLYWLGDDSVGAEATWAFLDRRIADVMAFEKVKAQVGDNPVEFAHLEFGEVSTRPVQNGVVVFQQGRRVRCG